MLVRIKNTGRQGYIILRIICKCYFLNKAPYDS